MVTMNEEASRARAALVGHIRERLGLSGWAGPPPAAILVACTLDLKPAVKERPRVFVGNDGKSRAITPARTADYEATVGWLVRRHVRGRRNDADDLGVMAVFRTPGRRRRDLDNLVKALLDGCNGIVWRDDHQVSTLLTREVRGSDHPGIDLCVYVKPPSPAAAS